MCDTYMYMGVFH